MADTAVYGRGIEPHRVSIIHNAVDTEIFKPDLCCQKYAHQAFNISEDRKIVFYSGHMEERKGVHVIIEAANELIRVRKRKDVHFLFLGNTDGQEKIFEPRYLGTESENFITFGGYREDISRILPSCYVGVIASTGWDSFTMSSMEIASSGLPLIVSNLQGLVETIENGKTGYLIEPSDHIGLAGKIELLLDDPELQKNMGSAGRQRVIENFSHERHIESLVATMRELYSRCYLTEHLLRLWLERS
jgi:glycosyltransferase involved in cell wall biosynthesis